MEIVKKRIFAKIYYFKIRFKSLFASKSQEFESLSIQDIIEKYTSKEKIVVVCSGPSTNKLEISDNYLYLVTNSSYSLVKKKDCLYYINDGFFIKKILSESSFLKANQELIFSYNDYDKKGEEYLLKNINLLNNYRKYFISKAVNLNNYNSFNDFYTERNLPVKIQNSGIFLLLLGYFLSFKMNIPIEIYGLDLGIGGDVHFDNKGVVGKSVLGERVKQNVKMYLSFMYNEKKEIINHSNFFPYK